MLIELIYQETNTFLFYSRLFSTSVATLFSFCLAILTFQPYIRFLRKHQLDAEFNTTTTTRIPVMPAGILFMMIILVSCFLTARFNSYMIYSLLIYIFFGLIGALDDIAKIVNKKRLLRGQITKADYQYKADGISTNIRILLYVGISIVVAIFTYKFIPNINGHITMPFYSITKHFPYLPYWLFIPLMALAIFTMANGVNFTDGIDTLATVPLITCFLFVGLIAYISSHQRWSAFLLIPYIPGVQEVLPLVGSVIGVLLAFLWFNSPPSSIIMGDSGSIGLGALIGILFVFIKAEFYLPIIGFIFILEFASSFLQIGYYKLTKKRLFLMAPIHHHFQIKMRKKGCYGADFNIKSKIAWRFHIISVVLLILGTILFLKVR
jgi:phospho-N-acetylmuramoyl-pentapeptide-transferase